MTIVVKEQDSSTFVNMVRRGIVVSQLVSSERTLNPPVREQ